MVCRIPVLMLITCLVLFSPCHAQMSQQSLNAALFTAVGPVPQFGNMPFPSVESARRLLDQGADVNAKDAAGRPVLTVAVLGQQSNIVQLILDRGARVNEKDKEGYTALKEAVEIENLPLTNLLLERGADPNARTYSDRPLLIQSALTGRSALFMALFNHGANVNAKEGGTGRTVLYYEVSALAPLGSQGNQDILRFLLAHGANVNASSGAVLETAVRYGGVDLVKELLSAGADPNLPNGGMLPLSLAAARGNAAIVEALLDKGAKINARYKSDPSTALMTAAFYGYYGVHHDELRLAVVKVLLDHRADTTCKNLYGQTALGIANRQRHFDRAKLLMQRGAK